MEGNGDIKICAIDQKAKDLVKKLRFKKTKENEAIVLKVEVESLKIVVDEQYKDASLEDIAEEIPASQPRYIIYSYAYHHDDGRISYPFVFIYVSPVVAKIIVNAGKCAEGVVLEDGTEIKAKAVLSNATPRVTFLDLVNKQDLQEDFIKEVEQIDFTSPVTKINVAVNSLPNFLASPNVESNKPLPHHYTTIHLNCEHTDLIHEAYQDAMNGGFSKKPVIEMTIPSSLDPTLVPPGCHVVQLFTQYTPYTLSGGQQWDEQTKNQYADTVFDDIEKYAPGFKASVIGRDILTPPDMERIFGLTGGNIFHGSMSLDQLYMSRPLPAYSDYRSPIQGLYLCGSGAHPGGGVMGAPGRLAAQTLLKDMKK